MAPDLGDLIALLGATFASAVVLAVTVDWVSILREYGLPTVMLAAFGYLIITGKLRTEREIKERDVEIAAVRKSRDAREEHMRREMVTAVSSWQALYNQERNDRLKADDRLTTATSELKEVTARVEELTKEVIRSASR